MEGFFLSYTEYFPKPGETIKASFLTSPGGKGANQAAQAAMLGATVCMIGRVSDKCNMKDYCCNIVVHGYAG